jgi:LacI family transcriptional regulator
MLGAATRDIVQRAVAELGRHAPRLCSERRRPRTGAVYLRCPYVLTDYFGLIVSAIAETLELHGRPLLLGAGEATQQSSVLSALGGRLDALHVELATDLIVRRSTGPAPSHVRR